MEFWDLKKLLKIAQSLPSNFYFFVDLETRTHSVAKWIENNSNHTIVALPVPKY